MPEAVYPKIYRGVGARPRLTWDFHRAVTTGSVCGAAAPLLRAAGGMNGGNTEARRTRPGPRRVPPLQACLRLGRSDFGHQIVQHGVCGQEVVCLVARNSSCVVHAPLPPPDSWAREDRRPGVADNPRRRPLRYPKAKTRKVTCGHGLVYDLSQRREVRVPCAIPRKGKLPAWGRRAGAWAPPRMWLALFLSVVVICAGVRSA